MATMQNAEYDCWVRYENGDSAAQTELFVIYTPLVDRIVGQIRRRLPRHIFVDDLRAAGLEGLWKALGGYSVTSNLPFEPYARVRIRGCIVDELRRMDPQTRQQRQNQKRAQDAYGMQVQQGASRLDEEVRMEWLVDDSAVSPEDAAVQAAEIAELNRALARLGQQEQIVLSLVFVEGLTLQEVSEVMDLSRSRISAVYQQALKRVKGSLIRTGSRR